MGPELTAGFCHQMSELTGLYLGSDGMPLLKATYAEFFFPFFFAFFFDRTSSVSVWEPGQWAASAHILGKRSPLFPILCPFIRHFLSPLHRLSGCVNNESIFFFSEGGWLFDCRWGEEVTGIHGFHSLSIDPHALNNSLTYQFFSWDQQRARLGAATNSAPTSDHLIDNWVSCRA